jgi:HSP20 family protein
MEVFAMAIKSLVTSGKKSVPGKSEEENSFSLLRHKIDSLFDDFFGGVHMEPVEDRQGIFSPKVDVTENDKDITVRAELPGIDDNDIEVLLNSNTLTIRGEKKVEKEQQGKAYYRMERSYGSFSRIILLPVEVDKDKIAAQLKKGVLTVTLPKSAKDRDDPKKIAVMIE